MPVLWSHDQDSMQKDSFSSTVEGCHAPALIEGALVWPLSDMAKKARDIKFEFNIFLFFIFFFIKILKFEWPRICSKLPYWSSTQSIKMLLICIFETIECNSTHPLFNGLGSGSISHIRFPP